MKPLLDGDRFTTPSVEVTESMRAAMIGLGGYTHPLFTQPARVALPGGSPLPGQAVLLLMGGLVEQSERLEDAVALLGLQDVRFRQPAVPGTVVTVRVEVVGHAPTKSGRRVREMRWQAVDEAGTVLVEATAQMLVEAAPSGAEQPR